MDAPKAIDGLWWVLGRKKSPVAGTLSVNSENELKLDFKLEAFGVLAQVGMALEWTRKFPHILHGQDRSGRPITLFGCTCGKWNISGGLSCFTVLPLIAILGQELSSWASAQYQAVRVQFTLLDQWLEVNPAKLVVSEKSVLQFEINLTPELEVTLSDGVVLKVSVGFATDQRIAEFRVNSNVWVTIAFPSATSFDLIGQGYIEVFRRFLTFCTAREVFVQQIEASPTSGTDDWMTIFLPTPGLQTAKRVLDSSSMLVPFDYICDRFAGLLAGWFTYHTSMKSALEVYFGSVFNSHLFGNHKCLFLAQALEVYHRKNSKFVGYAESVGDFEKRKKTILESAPPSQRDWLKAKLDYANEKTLLQRLNEILNSISEDIGDLITDPVGFAKQVRDTRNYYTHYSSGKRRRSPTDSDVYRLTSQMKALFEISVLRDLGITGHPINRAIAECRAARLISPNGIE